MLSWEALYSQDSPLGEHSLSTGMLLSLLLICTWPGSARGWGVVGSGPLMKVRGLSRPLVQVARKEIHQAPLRSSPPCPEGPASPQVGLTTLLSSSMTGIPGSPWWWWMSCLGNWEVRGVWRGRSRGVCSSVLYPSVLLAWGQPPQLFHPEFLLKSPLLPDHPRFSRRRGWGHHHQAWF